MKPTSPQTEILSATSEAVSHLLKNARTANQHRAGATAKTFWAAESRKSGVAPAQHGVLPVAKVSAVRSATSCYLDTCAKTVVTPTVTYVVTWAFCVAVTGPRWESIESVRKQRHTY